MSGIQVSEKDGVRTLHVGSALVQGAMRIARPWALELEYTREMLLPLALRPGLRWPRQVLQIGLGSASFTRFFHHHLPSVRLTVVEIEPGVLAAARQFFRLPPESAQLRIEIGDGHDFLAGTKRRFDLILVDGFDAEGGAGMLESLPFYLNCRARLNADGMLAANLLTHRHDIGPVVRRLREAFDNEVLVLPPSGVGNTVALAAKGEDLRYRPDALREGAKWLREATGVNLAPTLARLGVR